MSDEDLHERIRLLQEELAETNREVLALTLDLESRVEQRTLELSAANKELEAFSFSVSHDLRAPARHLSGFATILLRNYGDKLDAEGERLVRNICERAEHMGRLIDDLLEFSRLARMPLTKRPVRLNDLVSEVVRELTVDNPGRSVTFSIGDLPECSADGSLLKQVFVNLIANALKFTRHRENAKVEVTGRIEEQEVVCTVRDNGAGFDMTYADRLFGVFQRLHRQEEFEGTGVGLSIVQRIIARHGGRVWAEGEPDKGATFGFSLPV
jgi:light-regulated signal transduction histidine kinase (bacteriophytochrome)